MPFDLKNVNAEQQERIHAALDAARRARRWFWYGTTPAEEIGRELGLLLDEGTDEAAAAARQLIDAATVGGGGR